MTSTDALTTTPIDVAPHVTEYPFQALEDSVAQIHRHQVKATAYIPAAADRPTVTNELTRSQELTHADWGKSNATVTGSQADPLGESNAQLIEPTTGNGAVFQGYTSTGSTWTFSIWLKSATGTPIETEIVIYQTSGFVVRGEKSITVLPKWCRYYVTGTGMTAATAHSCYIGGRSTLETGEDLYAFGAQLETGSTAGAYVVTTTASDSRTSPPAAQHDGFAYLIGEGNVSRTANANWEWLRTYARVPGDQVEYASIAITKPEWSQFDGYTTVSYTDSAFVALGNLDQLTRAGTRYRAPGSAEVFDVAKSSTSANSGGNTRVTCTGHGVGSGESLLVAYSSGRAWLDSSEITIVDANTIDILGVNWGTNVGSVFPFMRDYTPGVDRVRTKRTQSFYLPGVTSGITTPEDIPIVSPAFDDEVFIDLILGSSTGFEVYDAEPLARWLDGPIYTQTKIEIDIDSL